MYLTSYFGQYMLHLKTYLTCSVQLYWNYSDNQLIHTRSTSVKTFYIFDSQMFVMVTNKNEMKLVLYITVIT